MNRKFLFILSLVVLVHACGSNSSKQPAPPPPAGVTVYEVQKGAVVFFDKYPATIVALNQVDIRPQVSGAITGIYFTDGQQVTKGQKLYSIDEKLYHANLEQTTANLKVAKSNFDRAQQDADRYKELAKSDAVAKQVVDHAIADLQTARMQVEAAKAAVKSVETNVRYATIYAPFDGTIGISQVRVGTAVTAGAVVLNTVSTDEPIAVDVAINEKEVYHFSEIQHKDEVLKDSVFTMGMPDGSIYPFPGKILLIDRAVDAQTATIKVRLQFPNPKKLLRSGMSCVLRVKNKSAQPQLMVPTKALLEQMGEYFVFKIGDSSKVLQKRVTTANIIGDKTVITDGIEEHDRIVLDGVQKMKEGVKVSIAAPKATAK